MVADALGTDERKRLYGQMDYHARRQLTGDQLAVYQSISGCYNRRALLSQWLETRKNIVSVIRSFEVVEVTDKSDGEGPLTRKEMLRKFGRASGLQYMPELEAEGCYEVDPRNPSDKCRWRYHAWSPHMGARVAVDRGEDRRASSLEDLAAATPQFELPYSEPALVEACAKQPDSSSSTPAGGEEGGQTTRGRMLRGLSRAGLVGQAPGHQKLEPWTLLFKFHCSRRPKGLRGASLCLWQAVYTTLARAEGLP